MNSTQYAIKLERKLIEEFKSNFLKKIGYQPIVLTKIQDKENDGYIKLMTLDQLKELFEPFLPKKYNKKLELGCRLRKREIVELRFIYSFIARRMNYSFVSIAKSIDRDHTTIIYSCEKFADLSETNDSFREKYLMILNHIKKETTPEDYELPNMEHLQDVQYNAQPALLP
jgi:chromosomal replication initiation ATPase DnaA